MLWVGPESLLCTLMGAKAGHNFEFPPLVLNNVVRGPTFHIVPYTRPKIVPWHRVFLFCVGVG